MTINCKGKTTEQVISELEAFKADKSSYVEEDEHELIKWNGNSSYDTINGHLFNMKQLISEEKLM